MIPQDDEYLTNLNFHHQVGNDWLLCSLWLQQIFAGFGRYRALTRLRLREARGAPLAAPGTLPDAAHPDAVPPPGAPPDAAPDESVAAAAPHAGLRARFERSVAVRAIDAHRLLQGMSVHQL